MHFSLATAAFLLGITNFAVSLNHQPRDDSGGVLIVLPPNLSNKTGLAQIPDSAHPFRAPGPNDQRGPCPGLNTLANHGYLPRNGIVSFAQIIEGTRDGYNMEYELAGALAAFAILARGNAFLDRLSIGGESPLIPPLPGKIDGPVVGGLAKHGRMEGDVSMTRQDAAIGDNRNFQVDLYDELLITQGEFGADSPTTGNRSVVTNQTMGEFKYRRFVEDQKANKMLQYHVGRFLLSYGEAGFPLIFFADGATGILSVEIMGSFFRNQSFPHNWSRRPSATGFDVAAGYAGTIFSVRPDVQPGANDAQGNYVVDKITDPCALYDYFGRDNLPGTLVNTTGILKKNVDTLLQVLYTPFKDACNFTLPQGPAGV